MQLKRLTNNLQDTAFHGGDGRLSSIQVIALPTSGLFKLHANQY